MKEGIIYKGHFCPVWGGLNSNKSEQFSTGGTENISVTILAGNHNAAVVTEEETFNSNDMAKVYRIRKLTPRECFRLMGASDEDISKIQNYPLVWDGTDFVAPEGMTPKELKAETISESQQYKMAGNSIAVPVLEGIFTQMFRKDSDALF